MQQTKAQEDLVFAEECVSKVEAEAARLGRQKLGKVYGGLCHNFPVLVRTCGLCQAVAFSKAKAAGEGNSDIPKAHQLLLEHLGEFLHKAAKIDAMDPLDAIRRADVMEYMLMTRRVLSVWIYFKRFAVSILKAETANDAEGEQGVDK